MENDGEKILYFSKYVAAGNHFILVNNTSNKSPFLNEKIVPKLCDVHFGIGGNGVIELLPCPGYDFEMKFHARDGSTKSMCGNGSRCAVILAYKENIVSKYEMKFNAIDGPHIARIIQEDPSNNIVEVKMKDIDEVKKINDTDYYVDVGTPHYVRFVQGVRNRPIISESQAIRNLVDYKDGGGTNANFAEWVKDKDTGKMALYLRTYERFNDAEILACGTGAMGGALVAHYRSSQLEQNGQVLQ